MKGLFPLFLFFPPRNFLFTNMQLLKNRGFIETKPLKYEQKSLIYLIYIVFKCLKMYKLHYLIYIKHLHICIIFL